jgi:hypothetical protein
MWTGKYRWNVYISRYIYQPKLNQEDNHLNRPMASNDIEAIIKSFPTKKGPGPDWFMADFYQTFKEIIPLLLKLFKEIERQGTLPNSFYEAKITCLKTRQGHNK